MTALLTKIIYGINSVINNYGISIILFTLLVKMLLLPLDFKSRKGMRKTALIQPEMQRLQKKYANDKEKLNQKVAELYRKEGVSPMSGCLPMIASMVVLWFMWGALRNVANTQLAEQCLAMIANGSVEFEGFLWIKNIWMPDSPFTSVIANQNILAMVKPELWQQVLQTVETTNPEQFALLAAQGLTAETITSETVFTALQAMPTYADQTKLWAFMPSVNLLITQLSIYSNNNGLFILPVLSAVTQYLMTLTQPQPAAANGQNNNGQFMKYFFPLFSLWICASQNALFSLYWVISNVFAWVQSIVLNKVFENAEKKEKAIKKEENLK